MNKRQKARLDPYGSPFSFIDQTDVVTDTVITSNSITVSGINAATTIEVSGGSYSVNNGTYTTAAGSVVNSDTVTVRHTSSSLGSTAVNTTLTIGGVSDTFTSTTVADDLIPDSFSFIDQTDVVTDTVITSNSITVSGINAATAITISGGSYAVNGGAYTSAAGSAVNGDTVTIQHTSSTSALTAVSSVLTIGGVSDTFTSSTEGILGGSDITPDAFSFLDRTDLETDVEVVSNSITVFGVNIPTVISISNGMYSINGNAYTSEDGTVVNGDRVTVRHTTSLSLSSSVSTTLAIGSVSGTFTSQTADSINSGNSSGGGGSIHWSLLLVLGTTFLVRRWLNCLIFRKKLLK